MVIAQAPEEMLTEIGSGFLMVISLVDITTRQIRNVDIAVSETDLRLPRHDFMTRFLDPAFAALTAPPAPPAPVSATA